MFPTSTVRVASRRARYLLLSMGLAALGLSVVGPAEAAKPPPSSRLYVASYNGDCTNTLSVIRRGAVTRSWEPVGGPCTTASAMAVRKTIRTLGVRPEFIGAEYTRKGEPTGVTYAYPSTVDMDLPDGTTDGHANYAGGYFDGVVYQFTRDWADPVPLFSTGVFLGGIAYDSDTDTLWVLDSRTVDEGGTGEIRNYRRDGTLLSSFVVRHGADPQPFALAYDAADNSLWISRIRGFDTPTLLEKYSTGGRHLDSVTPGLVGVAAGMEFRVLHQ